MAILDQRLSLFENILIQVDKFLFLIHQEEISLKKLVDLISEKLQKEPKIKTTENKPAYVLGSIEKMKLENFSHEITLHDGIDKMLDQVHNKR